jgi:hypothetical protein
VSSTGGSRTLQCRVSIDMTFPTGCRSLALIALSDYFALFPLDGSATIDPAYSIATPAVLTDPNAPVTLRGGAFADGERFVDEDGVAIVGRVPATRNIIFTDLISNSVNPGAAPRAGWSNVVSVNYRINSQGPCSS